MNSMVPSASPARLAEKLDTFFNLFQPTIRLAEDLINAKANPQEVVLLLCARLDALASCISREGQSNRQAFIHLLIHYAGHSNLMESVSAGDLYYELGFHRWLAEGMLPKPGRITRFSHIDDPIIHLLDRSGIPLTVEAARSLLTRIMRVIASNFRCRQGQPLRKPMIGKPKAIVEKLVADCGRSRDVDLRKNLPTAIQPLLDTKTVAGLLYENFRNNAVHGVKVQFDDATFFRAKGPYWEPLHSDYYPPFMFIKFSGPFLLQLLRNCTKTLKQKMLATGKLPPDVHFHAFGFDSGADLKFLNSDLLPKPASVRLQLK